MKDLYKEQILEHWREPRNYVEEGLGGLGKGWVKVRQANTNCGDVYELGVKWQKAYGKWQVVDIKFSGDGCAISKAGFSLFSREIQDTRHKIQDIDMEKLIGVKVSGGRKKCLMMADEAAGKALERHKEFRKIETVLRGGGVMIFPTDTVWGIGAWAGSQKGIERLYKIKGREKSKPTAILVSGIDQAKKLVKIKGKALGLVKKYWPGALTLVIDKVGLRVPNDEKLLSLLGYLGGGIMAGSANFAEKAAPRERKSIDKRLLDMVDVVMEGEAGGKEASTVIKIVGDKIEVLRKGPVKI